MALRTASMILAAAQAAAAQAGAEDTGRDLLFTDPTAALPDVYISQSVMYLTEGETFGYTVELTHQPGVREDETVDLQNDEVRIYLTSSQEVYQQDDEDANTVEFQQRVGHRTQLTINTNVKTVTLGTDLKVADLDNDVTPYNAHDIDTIHAEDPRVEGPTPYIYVRYSTVNPTQASPTVTCPTGTVAEADCPAGCDWAANACTGADYYEVVCPLCTHEAYCTQTTTVIAGTAVCADPNADPYADAGTDACSTDLAGVTATDYGVKFEGCYDIVYNGFAPIYDACSENGALVRYGAGQATPWDQPAPDALELVQEVYVGYNVLAADEAVDAGDMANWLADDPATPTTSTITANSRLKLRGEKSSNEPPTTASAGYHYQPYGEPNGPAPGIPYGDQAMKPYGCYPRVADFDGETYTGTDGNTASIIRRVRMGGEDPAWLTHEECWDKIRGVWSDCAGNMEAVPNREPFDPTLGSCSDAACEPQATDGIAGQSDFRIRADGSPVLRDIPRIDDYCRYCDKPGLFCDVDRMPLADDADAGIVGGGIDTWSPIYGTEAADTVRLTMDPVAGVHSATAVGLPNAANTLRGRECIKDTINGGDTAPNSANWLDTDYISGPSWRGDLSSGAQLVFDSTNWDTPQTVLVTARDDDVYEPNVFGRGQDAYVHHYVVAQDINLQHSYYEDIDVNDVVVSITDNDPAYVLQHDNEIEPTEGEDASDAPELKLRLASEPMYDVTIYVQSGSFLDAAGEFLPDDEQVVFQDAGQYNVCFDEETGLRSTSDTAVDTEAVGGVQTNDCSNDGTVANGATLQDDTNTDYENHGYAGRFRVHACDISGHYVTPESYKDATTGSGTTYDASEAYELPTGWSCNSYTTEAACTAAGPAAGCAWEDEDNIWTDCDCMGFNDHPTGGADGAGGDNGYDFGSVDASGSDGFMVGSASNIGALYPVCISAADATACEDVPDTERVWDAVAGCLEVRTAPDANRPIERKNDGYGTDNDGTGETPAMTEEQCTKTGNTHNADAAAGFCTTKQGSWLALLSTAADCLGAASAANSVGASVELSGADENPTTRGSCVEALQVTSQDGCVALASADACAGAKHCLWDGSACAKRTNFNAASKSMDIVCATYASEGDCNTEGCTWDALAAGGTGLCKAEKLGYDCNSYLTFTSTNWNSWQTLKVIAVDDDEDETVARPAGFDPSDIGYLIASRDWYYNSAGSKDIEGKRDALTEAMPATWSPGTPEKDVDRYSADIDISMFDTRFGVHINRYPWPASADNELAAGTVDCETQTDTAFDGDELLEHVLPSPQNGFLMSTGMDRVGTTGAADNGGRYSTTRRFVHNENGVSAWVDPLTLPVEQMKLYGVSTAGGHVDTPVGYTSEPKHNCKLKAPHAKDAGNQVCLGDTEATWAAQMVTSFAPPGTLGATCGATSKVTDTNIRQVTISRGFCQATEGRRFFYRDFMHQVNPTTAEWTGHVRGSQRAEAPSKLVTTLGQVKASPTDLDNFPTYLSATTNNANGEPADMWTSAYAREDVTFPIMQRVMTMPTCPFTIKLETAPLEGATVVVEVFEDPELVAMRDHELYFYEEPTFRPGVATQYECETHFPGSKWIAKHDGDNPVQENGAAQLAENAYRLGGYTSGDGSCFIQNVPYVEPADPTNVFLGLGFQPRGGTSLEVMFTAADWDVPRRITAIALNDDVDEPDEYRGIFFNTKGCTGYNHNQGTVLVDTDAAGAVTAERLACVEDPLYNDAVISTIEGDGVNLGSLNSGRDDGPKDSITVQVIDDDIADLVVLCGDNPSAFQDECTDAGTAVTTQTACDALPGCAWSSQAGTDAGRCLFDYEDDEQFIGSYDDSHPHNRWDEGVERRGANAEDGMSYSRFGGGISTMTDGITGAAGTDESCDNCGYVSIVKSEGMTSARCATRTITPGTLNTLTQDETWAEDFEEGCYPDTTPLDKLCVATDPTDAAADTLCSGLVLDSNFDTTCGSGAYSGCTLVASAGAQVGGYDPYTDQWCVDSPTTGIADDWDATAGIWTHAGTHCGTYVNIANHARGFKGAGPAFTEDTNTYACTIHSRECHDDDGTLTDSEGAACTYGTFKIRLNSSPGVKKVKRHYTGSSVTETETELVYIVVTPDETPQTSFNPASVTFTETGGLVNGVATQRWDHPIEIEVVPKDDDVDERMGVIVDFTAFSIKQSHAFDEYWKYTIPYMNLDAPTYPFTGEMCVPKAPGTMTDAAYDWQDCEGGKGDKTEAEYLAASSSGRIDGHTAYRHTIRTVHTMDNDYSGVRLQSGATTQTKDTTANTYSHTATAALTATEGGTFAWYSIVLDTKPHKVQRQTGTNPNKVLVHDAVNCADEADSDGSTFNVGDFFGDYTDATRPDVCGSVEPSADYWVDVTVTQTIHVDLAAPASCPTTAPWGGGSTPPTTVHPRFPFNGKIVNSVAQPFDELVDRPGDMDGYLTTCGDWQRDATYRFTADDWNIPQFVYLYAHNDRDAANAASGATGDDYVRRGGNELFDEGQTYYTTTLKHYVETEDTLDNIEDTDHGKDKFVQWNKHGGIYTFGNIERFPFGYDRMSRMTNTKVWGCPENAILDTQAYAERYADEAAATTACGADRFVREVKYGALEETGTTTWGYSKYESLYGYGYFKEGVWSTEGCCSTSMGGAWGAYATGISNWGTTGGVGGTDSNDNGEEFRTARSELTEQPPDPLSRFVCSFARPGSVAGAPSADGLVHVGAQCIEPLTGQGEPRPYNNEGEFCTPTVETGTIAADVTDAANVFQFCLPRFATSYQTYYDPVADETDRTTGVAMKFPPNDVEVRVSDNDAMADQDSAAVASCKQTQFVMWSDAENPLMTDSTGVDTSRSAWLLDYNCEPSGDGAGNAGGLPGYPTSRDADGSLNDGAGDAAIDPTGR